MEGWVKNEGIKQKKRERTTYTENSMVITRRKVGQGGGQGVLNGNRRLGVVNIQYNIQIMNYRILPLKSIIKL